jgi:hypothetical protein
MTSILRERASGQQSFDFPVEGSTGNGSTADICSGVKPAASKVSAIALCCVL